MSTVLKFSDIISKRLNTTIDEEDINKYNDGEKIGDFLARVRPDLKDSLRNLRAPVSDGALVKDVRDFGRGNAKPSDSEIDHKKLLLAVLTSNQLPFVMSFNKEGEIKCVESTVKFSASIDNGRTDDYETCAMNLIQNSSVVYKKGSSSVADAFENKAEWEAFRSTANSIVTSAKGSVGKSKLKVEGEAEFDFQSKEHKTERTVYFAGLYRYELAYVTLKKNDMALTAVSRERYEQILNYFVRHPIDDVNERTSQIMKRFEEYGIIVPTHYIIGGVIEEHFDSNEKSSVKALSDSYNVLFGASFGTKTPKGEGEIKGGAGATGEDTVTTTSLTSYSKARRNIRGGNQSLTNPSEWVLSLNDYTSVYVIDSSFPIPVWELFDERLYNIFKSLVDVEGAFKYYKRMGENSLHRENIKERIELEANNLAEFSSGASSRSSQNPVMWTKAFGITSVEGDISRILDEKQVKRNDLDVLGGALLQSFFYGHDTGQDIEFGAPDQYIIAGLKVESCYYPCGKWNVLAGNLGLPTLKLGFHPYSGDYGMTWTVRATYIREDDLKSDARQTVYNIMHKALENYA